MISLVQAIRETGLSETAIRHYESKGLITAPRSNRGAVLVTQRVVRQLHTIAAARRLGFSVEECGLLFQSLKDGKPTCVESKRVISQIEERKRDLERVCEEFYTLANQMDVAS